MVLRLLILVDAPYMPGRVVDRERDNNLVESYVVHPPYIGLAGPVLPGVVVFCHNIHKSNVPI